MNAKTLTLMSNTRLAAMILAAVLSPFQLSRASDLAPASPDLYNSTQKSLINTFQTQSLLALNANNPDLSNIANVVQNSGEANLAIILQSGSHNVSFIDQSGGSQNTAMIKQDGTKHTASITQTGGSGNAALISQR